MKRFVLPVLLFGCAPVSCMGGPAPAAVWRDAGNPAMLTNSIPLPQAFTATAWFEADSFGDFAPVLTCTSDFSSWTNGFGVFTTDDGRLRAFARSIDGPALSAPAPDAGAPCHVAFVYSGSAASLYVNGVLAASAGFAAGPAPGACGPLWAGTPPDSDASPPFDGEISEVRLYFSALDRAAVGTEYSSGLLAMLKAAGRDVSRIDSDGDGMPDEWELRFGLNPCDSADAARDSDGDGMENIDEFQLGRNPRSRAAAAPRPLIRSCTVATP